MKKRLIASLTIFIFLLFAGIPAFAGYIQDRGKHTVQSELTWEQDQTFEKDVNIYGTLTAMAVSNEWYVYSGTKAGISSGDSRADNRGKGWKKPFKTIKYALTQAKQGDVIHALPGHKEIYASALKMNVAGVTIIGHGSGRDIPTFYNQIVLTAATGCTAAADNIAFSITGANCRIENIMMAPSTSSSYSEIYQFMVGAADVVIRNCIAEQSTYDYTAVGTTSAADRVMVEGNTFTCAGAGPTSAIELSSSSIDRPIIRFNTFDGGSDAYRWTVDVIYDKVGATNKMIYGNKFSAWGPNKTAFKNLYNRTFGMGDVQVSETRTVNLDATAVSLSSLYSITGGDIEVLALYAEVVTKCYSTAAGPVNYTLTVNPEASGYTSFALTGPVIANAATPSIILGGAAASTGMDAGTYIYYLASGGFISVTTTVNNGSASGGTSLPMALAQPIVVPRGTIDMAITDDIAGALKFTMKWRPIGFGAAVKPL
uniref:Uncharacterized protein n=1 Tax=viral metagenome TaxID=1070528 RepID=A0A6M3KFP4_9ZZZZ